MSIERHPLNEIDSVGECISFELNRQEVSVTVEPSKRLIDILRNDLKMTGTKISCEIGRCGSCMVLIDDQPFNSCLTMAYQCAGKQITTIEGISEDGIDPIQQLFIDEGGFQCGYCTPGMIISLKGVLKENPKPTLEELKAGLAGNLCRCTGFGGIIRSIEQLSNQCVKE